MKMYLKNGNTFSQMARLAGVNEATVSRRIHKITKRLTDGEYITCLQNSNKFSNAEMRIARDYFLLGLSLRKIAVKRRCSYYRIRQTMKKVQQLVGVAGGEGSEHI